MLELELGKTLLGEANNFYYTRVFHKGHVANIEYSEEDKAYFGIIEKNGGEICFGGNNFEELRKNMIEAIDGHDKNCKELGLKNE